MYPKPNLDQFMILSFTSQKNLCHNIQISYKKSKNTPLTQDQKDHNRALSKIRVKVENVCGQIKTFKILSERYRNKGKRYHVKFNCFGGIVNMKNGLTAAEYKTTTRGILCFISQSLIFYFRSRSNGKKVSI